MASSEQTPTTLPAGLGEVFQRLVDAAPWGVLLADPQGRVAYANAHARQLLEADLDQLRARQFPEGFIVEHEEVPFQTVLAQSRPWNKVLLWQFSNGDPEEFETSLIPLPGADSSAFTAVLLTRPGHSDMAERRFVQTEKLNALDNVVAGVAHELNNPLTVVLGYSELLLEKPLDPEIRSRIAIICEKAERCRRIVDNLLRFSRSKDAPRMPVRLNDLLRDTLTLCEYQLSVDGIILEAELEANLPALSLQRREIQGTILSLVNNAQQALIAVPSDRRRLRVKSEGRDGNVRLIFEDTGCGIPEDIQQRIFDPFFTTRDVGEGLGLGLSVAYGVVLEHHGRVWLEKSSTEGSTFVIELPVESAGS